MRHRLGWIVIALPALASCRSCVDGRARNDALADAVADAGAPESPVTDASEVVLRPTSCGKAHFGDALAADGDRLLVGATARDSGQGSPGACLYERTPAGWRLAASFARGTHGTYDDFATSVAMSGTLVSI